MANIIEQKNSGFQINTADLDKTVEHVLRGDSTFAERATYLHFIMNFNPELSRMAASATDLGLEILQPLLKELNMSVGPAKAFQTLSIILNPLISQKDGSQTNQ